MRHWEHEGVLGLLRQGKELFTQYMRRPQLTTYTITIPQSAQHGEKPVKVFQMFTEVLSTDVGLPNFRSCEAFRRNQRCS